MNKITSLANHFSELNPESFKRLSVPLKVKILSQIPEIQEEFQKAKQNAKAPVDVKNKMPPFEGDIEPFLDEALAKELFTIGDVFSKFLDKHYFSIKDNVLTIRSGQLTHGEILKLLTHISQKEKMNITSISLTNSEHLESLEFLKEFPNLINLDISGSHSVTTLKGIEYCKFLKELVITHCSKIVSLEGLPATVDSLRANSCVSLTHIDAIKRCPLKLLDLSSNPKITSLDSISELVTLVTLYLRHLPKLTSLKRLTLLVNLKRLDISYTSVNDISAISGRKFDLFKYDSCPFASNPTNK